MKHINSIVLFLAFLTIENFNYCAQQISPEHIALRLTQESYISPEMQWSVISLFDAQGMTIHTKTGAVQGIKSIDFMLDFIHKKLENSISFVTKESMKNALQSMLEATELAAFVAAIEAAYNNQKYIIYQDIDTELSTILHDQKNKIHNAISRVNGTIPYDQPVTSMSSFFSWFGTPNSIDIPAHVEPLHFNDGEHADEFITIPKNLVLAIIEKNDYKLKDNPKEAAELLFKECFIAQQQHLKNNIEKLEIKLDSPLKPHNYIFDRFHSIHEACEIAKKIVPSHPKRTDLQAPVSPEQISAHRLLLSIRQALQTALYIANAKSSYNVGYILPASVTAYLNGAVNELLQHDIELDKLCKAPEYGATQDDIYRDEQWAMITKLAAGTVAAAAFAGGLYFFAPVAAISSLITGGAGTAATAAKGAAALTTAQQIWQAGAEAKKYTDAIGEVGTTVAKYGGGAAFGAKIIKDIDKSGVTGISLSDIDAASRELTGLDIDTRYILDLVQKVGSNVATVGAAGAAIGTAGSAIASVAGAADAASHSKNWIWSDDILVDKRTGIPILDAKGNKLYNTNSALYNAKQALWNSGTVVSSGMDTLNKAQNAIGVGAVAFGVAANQLTGMNNQHNQNLQSPAGQIPPQTITNVFIKLIQDGTTQDGVDSLTKIATASQNLLQQKKTTPAALAMALQNVQKTIQQENIATPEIAQGINQITQKVASLAQ